MKNGKYLFMFMAFVICLFVPNVVLAAGAYSVEMVTNTSNNKVIGTYSTYSEALGVMNSQTSTSTSVASIYKNGKIINSKYALFQLKVKSSSTTINLYQNAGDSTSYTYTAPYYMSDAALIDSNESRVNIMYNGFRGWANIDDGNIIPISLLGGKAINITAVGLNLRSSYSTSSSSIASITCTNQIFAYTDTHKDGSYTWYKISYNDKTGWVRSGEWLSETTMASINTYYYRYSTGNLLHRYTKHNGVSYIDDYTNLGPTPSYLAEGVRYYSFDGGVYLYSDYTTMIDDYKNNTYSHSLNSNNPNYPYYLYLPGKSVSKVTASDLDKQITNTSSKLYGQGVYFKEAEELYGMNALSAFATARNESASGTSAIAMDKNNVFGYGASDSCPYACAKSYSSVRESILDYAKNGLSSYMTAENKYYFGSHAGTKGSGRNVKYASDALWGEKQAWNAFMADKDAKMRDYKANTIAVSKYGKYNLPVYKEADGKTVIYYMRNSNSNFKVYNVPVTAIERVGDYYKIYADSNTYQYGYVKASDFNITNSEPVINASSKEIKLGSTFDYKNGVTASDTEDGNLTSKISYTGTVDVNKAGIYKVTYKVTDNSNFTTNKEINVTVKGESAPVIDASDKEISQYTSFDYMEGVRAVDDIDGDITSKVTYEETVDTDVVGEYKVVYSAVNSKGKSSSKEITVKVIENAKPVIEVSDKNISLNKEFNPMDGVKASDKEDGDLTDKVVVTSNNVDTSVEGEYSVSFEVSDSALQASSKTIKVNVSVKTLEEKKDGLFYLDYVKNAGGKLQIKGYNTIPGVDNNLDNDITYTVIFENIDSLETVEERAIRITDTKEMPKTVYGLDDYDYTYSWFKLDIDFSILPVGNYKMYVVSEDENYYSKNLISNKLNKQVDSSYVVSDKKINLRRNYSYSGSPIELVIRDKDYVTKTSGTYYNQFDKYTKFEFNEDKLHLRGVSYSYGADLSSGTSVSRKLIIENMDDYTSYYKELGSITNGNYMAVLPEDDNFDKTRAWYDAEIDLSDIPKGNYVLYITTSSNITDIYEMTEKLGRSLDSVKKNIDGKNYSFKINKTRGNRIEMTVE